MVASSSSFIRPPYYKPGMEWRRRQRRWKREERPRRQRGGGRQLPLFSRPPPPARGHKPIEASLINGLDVPPLSSPYLLLTAGNSQILRRWLRRRKRSGDPTTLLRIWGVRSSGLLFTVGERKRGSRKKVPLPPLFLPKSINY